MDICVNQLLHISFGWKNTHSRNNVSISVSSGFCSRVASFLHRHDHMTDQYNNILNTVYNLALTGTNMIHRFTIAWSTSIFSRALELIFSRVFFKDAWRRHSWKNLSILSDVSRWRSATLCEKQQDHETNTLSENMLPALPVLLVRLLLNSCRRHDEVVKQYCLAHLQRPTIWKLQGETDYTFLGQVNHKAVVLLCSP